MVDAEHQIGRIFFYNEAVAVANRFSTDDSGTRQRLTRLASEAHFELAVCVTAAARRGIVANASLADGFVVVGLGQLIEAIEDGDRLVSF